MPRYYCDYCDTYLTHDSPVVRKQHNTGYKHKANVRNYYMQFEEAQTQDLIDNKIMEHLAKAGAGPGQFGAPIGSAPLGVPAYNPPSHPALHAPPAGSQPPPGTVPYRPPVGLPPPQMAYRPPQMQAPPSQYAYQAR